VVGALAWLTLSAPRARRGQTLGTAFGFAVLGFIVGPRSEPSRS